MSEFPVLNIDVTECVVEVLCRRPLGLSWREIHALLRKAGLRPAIEAPTRRSMLLLTLHTSQIGAGDASPVQRLLEVLSGTEILHLVRRQQLFADLDQALRAYGLEVSGNRISTVRV